MKKFIKYFLSLFFTKICLFNIKHGCRCKCNFFSKFTPNTIIGDNCHFNGAKIYGDGKVMIGNNFHSGKNLKILTTYHNYDSGKRLPYDDTNYSRNVIIGDNVWIGDDVLILSGCIIGEGAVIQAGSVVCVDIPPLGIAGGHPAIVFKYRNRGHYYLLKNFYKNYRDEEN